MLDDSSGCFEQGSSRFESSVGLSPSVYPECFK